MAALIKFLAYWELEISILLSLLLQIFLTPAAHLRKRRRFAWVGIVIWNTYVAINVAAKHSLNIISRTLNDPGPRYNPEVLAFWTPFLLLYWSGPDSITALSLEDSQLWLRNVLSLLHQLIGTGYILMRSLTTHSKLFFPTLFVLAAGVIKCGERSWALKRASIDDLETSLLEEREPAPGNDAFTEELSSYLRAGDPETPTLRMEKQRPPEYFVVMKGSSDSNAAIIDAEEELVYGAYLFLQAFKCLFLDMILTFQDLGYSASILHKCSSSRAFKMIEIELSYAYDIFYTKALILHTTQGLVFHAISFCSILIAFCLFLSSVKQLHDFQRKEISLSFVLLAGTLALEFVSMGMLILSDWTVVMLRQSNLTRLEMLVFQILCRFHRLIGIHRRWSNRMGQYSLLTVIIMDPSDTLPQKFGNFLRRLLGSEDTIYLRYTRQKVVSEKLKDLIFTYLKDKSEKITQQGINLPYITRQGRQWASQFLEVCSVLKWSIDAEFDESLLTWHLATEICLELQQNLNSDVKDHCEASRDLSRYLLCLLFSRRPAMSSKAGLALIRHGDTCKDAKMFLEKERVAINTQKRVPRDKRVEARNKSAAVKSLMKRNYFQPDKLLKGDNKSILWDAVELARELQELPEDERWKTAYNVWIEMLAYVAVQCKGMYHARMLPFGGELLTFVWFLEAHLGEDTTQ